MQLQSQSRRQALDRAVGSMDSSHASVPQMEKMKNSTTSSPYLDSASGLPSRDQRLLCGRLPGTGGLHVTVIGSYGMELSMDTSGCCRQQRESQASGPSPQVLF